MVNTSLLYGDHIDELLIDGSNRGVVTDGNWLLTINQYSNKTFKFTKLEEKIMTDYWSFIIINNDILYPNFNQIVVQLVESGIANQIMKDYLDFFPPNDDTGNCPLTLDHLEIWFLICAFPLSFALCCFFAELVLKKCGGKSQ